MFFTLNIFTILHFLKYWLFAGYNFSVFIYLPLFSHRQGQNNALILSHFSNTATQHCLLKQMQIADWKVHFFKLQILLSNFYWKAPLTSSYWKNSTVFTLVLQSFYISFGQTYDHSKVQSVQRWGNKFYKRDWKQNNNVIIFWLLLLFWCF